MRYFAFAILVALAVSSPAQVTVTNNGFATTPGVAVPVTPVSPPVMFAPIVRLDQGATQPIQATAATNGVTPAPVVSSTASQNSTLQLSGTAASQEQQPFNFGVAQYGRGVAEGSVGQDINGKSLGEIAREMKHQNSVNARTYTNNDINAVSNSGGVAGAAASASNANDNWTPDNGVINPEGQVSQPNAVGALQQNPPSPEVRNPFAPRSQSYNPAGIDTPSNQPSKVPQPDEKPSAQHPVEIAQNTAPPMPQDQNAASSQNSADQNQPAPNNAKAGELPRSASKLPLIGVLGLFSVGVGIFVRFQRAKSR